MRALGGFRSTRSLWMDPSKRPTRFDPVSVVVVDFIVVVNRAIHDE